MDCLLADLGGLEVGAEVDRCAAAGDDGAGVGGFGAL